MINDVPQANDLVLVRGHIFFLIHAPATARETKWTFKDHGVNTTLWVYNNASKQNYLLLQGPQKKIFLHNYDYDEVWVPVRCVKNY